MMKRNIKLYGIIALFVLMVLAVGGYIYHRQHQPKVLFDKNVVEVELNHSYEVMDNIKSYYKSNGDDYILKAEVHYDQVGDYTVELDHKKTHRRFSYVIHVVDKIAPEFDVIEKTIEQNREIQASEMVENIVDESKTTVYFAKNYDFSSLGDLEVDVIVEDESQNKTQKKTVLHIIEPDLSAPEILGVKDRTIDQYEKFDLMSGISVKDNRDEHPSLEVDDGGFNSQKVGDYTVRYIARDEKGNEKVETCHIHVKPKIKVDGRVVYLTIDDGPSANTRKVLDILDTYGVKATFFVTGNGSEYRDLIKEAHEKGHQIGLHTYCHQYKQVYSSIEAYYQDLESVGEMVEELIGYVPRIIRFPGGSSNTASKHYTEGIMTFLANDVMERGYFFYDWNVAIGDGGSYKNADFYVNQTISQSSGVAEVMLLMHDGPGCEESVKALPRIIEWFLKEGYTFKVVDETTRGFHHRIAN